jgi:hypothetical protein
MSLFLRCCLKEAEEPVQTEKSSESRSLTEEIATPVVFERENCNDHGVSQGKQQHPWCLTEKTATPVVF